jgi:quinolinate synthase
MLKSHQTKNRIERHENITAIIPPHCTCAILAHGDGQAGSEQILKGLIVPPPGAAELLTTL